MQVIVRDVNNVSRVVSGLGTGPGGSSSCYAAPVWTNSGLNGVEVVVVCGTDNSSLCSLLVDVRTSCSAGMILPEDLCWFL